MLVHVASQLHGQQLLSHSFEECPFLECKVLAHISTLLQLAEEMS